MQVTRGTVGPPQPKQTRETRPHPQRSGWGVVFPDVCIRERVVAFRTVRFGANFYVDSMLLCGILLNSAVGTDNPYWLPTITKVPGSVKIFVHPR